MIISRDAERSRDKTRHPFSERDTEAASSAWRTSTGGIAPDGEKPTLSHCDRVSGSDVLSSGSFPAPDWARYGRSEDQKGRPAEAR